MPAGYMKLGSKAEVKELPTGPPEETLFRVVHKRHTHFTLQTFEEAFHEQPAFGETSTCTLSKVGDLLHSAYLKVELEELAAPRTTQADTDLVEQLQERVATLSDTLEAFKDFVAVASQVVNRLDTVRQTLTATVADIQTTLSENVILLGYARALTTFADQTVSTTRPVYQLLATDVPLYVGLDVNLVALLDVEYLVTFATFTTLDDVAVFISMYRQQVVQVDRIIRDELKDARSALDDATASVDSVSYGSNVGHAMIRSVEIDIGGKRIDMINGQQLAIYQSLKTDPIKTHLVSEMLGEVPALTRHDNTAKPAYTLLVPLPFWFSENVGSALPMVCLRYHDVRISVTFVDGNDCVFTLSSEVTPVVRGASLLTTYAFLEERERQLFGNMAHDYVIQQHQHAQYRDVTDDRVALDVNFFNPLKDVFWTVRNSRQLVAFPLDAAAAEVYRVSQTLEEGGKLKLAFADDLRDGLSGRAVRVFKTHPEARGRITGQQGNVLVTDIPYARFGQGCYAVIGDENSNPVVEAYLEVDGVPLFAPRDGTTFVDLQPYQHYPSHGLSGYNVFSFCLLPRQAQSSGFLNVNRLKRLVLYLKLDPNFVTAATVNGDSLVVDVSARNINVLRIENGRAVLAFNQ